MDPTGTKTLTDGLQAFGAGMLQQQRETAAQFQALRMWCDGLDVVVQDVQEGLATVHAELTSLENKVDVLRDDMNQKFDAIDQKFTVLFKHLGIQ